MKWEYFLHQIVLLNNKYINKHEIDNSGNTILHDAVLFSSPEIIEQLLLAKIDPMIKNKNGETVLSNALNIHNKLNAYNNEIKLKITEDDGKGYLASKIRSKISSFESSLFDELKESIKNLKLYRKVTMHSLSHGQTGQHNWSDKEIKQTLILLKKLETNIKDLTNSTTN